MLPGCTFAPVMLAAFPGKASFAFCCTLLSAQLGKCQWPAASQVVTYSTILHLEGCTWPACS